LLTLREVLLKGLTAILAIATVLGLVDYGRFMNLNRVPHACRHNTAKLPSRRIKLNALNDNLDITGFLLFQQNYNKVDFFAKISLQTAIFLV
jgi:hypothetical protein